MQGETCEAVSEGGRVEFQNEAGDDLGKDGQAGTGAQESSEKRPEKLIARNTLMLMWTLAVMVTARLMQMRGQLSEIV